VEDVADLKRRHRCRSYEELLERAGEASDELAALDGGVDPAAAAVRALAEAEARVDESASRLRAAREEAAPRFADAVASELAGLGMGDGEFAAELSAREAGARGRPHGRGPLRPR